MSRSSQLELLIELQRRERDRVAALAARARSDANTAESTLQMLVGYRADHDTRSPKRATAAFTATTVRVHEAFTGKLDHAIGEQGAISDRLAEASAAQTNALAERQRRLKALETLAERRAVAARQKSERFEQNQTDEYAIQAYLRSQR